MITDSRVVREIRRNETNLLCPFQVILVLLKSWRIRWTWLRRAVVHLVISVQNYAKMYHIPQKLISGYD